MALFFNVCENEPQRCNSTMHMSPEQKLKTSRVAPLQERCLQVATNRTRNRSGSQKKNTQALTTRARSTLSRWRVEGAQMSPKHADLNSFPSVILCLCLCVRPSVSVSVSLCPSPTWFPLSGLVCLCLSLSRSITLSLSCSLSYRVDASHAVSFKGSAVM